MQQQHQALPPMTGNPIRDRSLLWSVIRKNWQDLIKLNLLFFLTCLPVITIPAARTAMAKVSLRLLQDQPCVLRRDYFSAFKENFPDATKAGLLFLAGKLLCLYVLFFYSQWIKYYPAVWAVLILLTICLLFLLLAEVHLYLQIASVQLPVKTAIKNTCLLVTLRLPSCVLAVVSRGAALLLLMVLLPIAPLYFFTFLFSLPGLVTASCAWPGVRQYLIQDKAA